MYCTERAVGALARHHRRLAEITAANGDCLDVQPIAARLLVRTMTAQAVRLEDRPHVAVKVDRLRGWLVGSPCDAGDYGHASQQQQRDENGAPPLGKTPVTCPGTGNRVDHQRTSACKVSLSVRTRAASCQGLGRAYERGTFGVGKKHRRMSGLPPAGASPTARSRIGRRGSGRGGLKSNRRRQEFVQKVRGWSLVQSASADERPDRHGRALRVEAFVHHGELARPDPRPGGRRCARSGKPATAGRGTPPAAAGPSC